MKIKKINLIVFLVFLFFNTFSENNRTIRIENHIRYGFDDNLNHTPKSARNQAVASYYLSDIVSITSKIIPSESSTLLLFYQPEFTHRFDADDKFLYLQDLYVNYIHSISPISQFQLTDRFRISEPDVNQTDGKSYAENNLRASYQKNISETTGVNLLFGFTERVNEDNQNRRFGTRDFKRMRLSYLLSREIDAEKKTLSGGINYNDHTIQHDGGSIDTSTIFAGFDYKINPRLLTSTQIGYTFGTINQAEGSDSINYVNKSSKTESPFFELGVNYEVSKNTKINSSYSYSLRYTTLSLYNAELRSDFLIGVQHKFTPKMAISCSISKVITNYESEFLRLYSQQSSLEDNNTIINIRGEYNINRNHTLEAGYQNRERNGWDSQNQDYSRNRMYVGWQLNI